MNEKEYLSRYLDGLDSDDLKEIETFPLPWQRNFITRFYEQLSKQHLSKKDVTELIKNQGENSSLLPNDYIVPQNTLSQFTNYKSSKMRTVSVTNLIAVSLALGVSINYLLGIDSCETPENTNINRATGLTNQAIETIKRNDTLQENLNLILLSPKIEKICDEIEKLYLAQRVSGDILNAYSKELFGILEKAYTKFFSNTFALDRSEEKYREYLSRELSCEEMKLSSGSNSIMDYLKSNLSADRLTQIQLQLEKYDTYNEKDIYHIFIYMTADYTYTIFEEKIIRETLINRITQSITSLIEELIQAKIQTKHEILRNIIKK